MVYSVSSWQKISSTWPCLTVRLFVFWINTFACNIICHRCHIYGSRTPWLCCSSLAERGGACRSWMCLGSLPYCEWKRSRALPLSSTAAGGVGAVLRTADSSAGKRDALFSTASSVWLFVLGWAHTFMYFMSITSLRLISKAWKNSRGTRPSWACHTFDCFSHPFLWYCDSVVHKGSQLQMSGLGL